MKNFKNLRIGVMVRVPSLGEIPLPLVFDGGPRSLGDELIVRTSRFLAAPKNTAKKKN